MIYLLYGNNFTKSREKVREIIASQMKKNADASYFRITSENWEKGRLTEFEGGKGLFQSKYIIVLDGLLANKESSEVIIDSLDLLKDSENIFIILEEKLTKEIVKKIGKRAEKVQEFVSAGDDTKKENTFNVFALTDALGARDKKELWVLYQKALFSGMQAEEIHRLFFWQAKTMLAASQSQNATDAGLKPFVYSKALGFSKRYSDEELKKLSINLVLMYHEARRGRVEFDTAMELFVLGI